MHEPARDQATPKRDDYLTLAHGLQNIAHVLLTHVLLISWFALAPLTLPVFLYLLLSPLAALIHQRAVSEWIHEGSHHNLVRDRIWNDRLTDALVGVWFGLTVAAYRSTHFPHHTTDAFFEDGDPDTDFLAVSSRRELRRAVMRDLTGRAILRQFKRFDSSETPARSPVSLLVAAALQLVLVTALYTIGRLDAYVIYYATLCTLYPLLNRLRVYGQHVSLCGETSLAITGGDTSRTIDAGWLDRVIWTSPRLLYHHEHHRFPALPYRALAQICERVEDPDLYTACRWKVLRSVYLNLPPV